MTEKELRALFADAVAKGAMTAADLDKLVADKIAKGECKSDKDDDKDDDDKDEKDRVDFIDKAAANLAEVTEKLNKAETNGWEDPGAPSTGATNPETRPPTERKTIAVDADFSKFDPSSVMEDIVKAASAQFAAVATDLLKAAIEDIADHVGDAIAKATKPQTDRIKALVANAKAQNEVLKAVGDSVKKAATKRQVADLAKAGLQAKPQGHVVPFQRPDLASLQVVPAPGDRQERTGAGGQWTHEGLANRIDEEIGQLTKGSRGYETTNRLNALADAQLRLSTMGSDPDAIARSINIQAA